MPLQDHFNPPLSQYRHWHSFHNAWATSIAYELNRLLPEGYFAEPNVQFGIEIDVAAFEYGNGKPGGWTPSGPVLTVPFPLITDLVEIQVFSSEEGPILAGAIELVSPSNKDSPEHRNTFVSKCLTYLQQGVGLVIVDVVTSRKANLHDSLLKGLNCESISGAALYASAYRPVDREKEPNLEIWAEDLALDCDLPTLPLWLKGGHCLAVDLEETYSTTCRQLRVSVPA